MTMTKEEFMAFLSPEQLHFIIESIEKGLADYNNPLFYSDEAKVAHTSSVRAQIRNAHIVFRAKEILINTPNIGIVASNRSQRLLFYINGQNLLSFKMLDRNLLSHNYPTRQARAFNAQQWPLEMSEENFTGPVNLTLWPKSLLAPLTNVIGGYLFNQAETSFSAYVTCPDGEGNAWDWHLTTSDIAEIVRAEDITKTDAVAKIHRRPISIRPGVTKKKKRS